MLVRRLIMISIKTAVKLIVLSFIAGLFFEQAVKHLYYYIKYRQRQQREYKEITYITDLKDWR
jgi:hypothetical protein